MIKPIWIKYVLLLILAGNFYILGRAQNQQLLPLIITIDVKDKAQTIENFGASGCWYAESIGKYWPVQKKGKIAELLFSSKIDLKGKPLGIGLSAWRFNIGGGTNEQGIAGGIKDPQHRVECFLEKEVNYNWNKQAGYRWFLKKAKDYGVEQLIAFANTPPVFYTKNGFGYKTDKDYRANLQPEKYAAYANFLTEVIKHFDKQGLHFNYISPVNEPQWDWFGKPGEAKQEGTSWTNEEIAHVIKFLDSSLFKNHLKTKILTTEAGMLSFLYGGNTAASRQIQHLFYDSSLLNIGNLKSVPRIIAAHSYFTDKGDSSLISTRRSLADTSKKYGVKFWQSEYCMLGDGYKESSKEKRTPMDCALFLAKIIHNDLTVANASAWQYWNAFEPGGADFDTRYYLIALKPDSRFKNGNFTVTKNLWSLGHYSLFIRPGMQRINIKRNDGMLPEQAAQNTMVSAFTNDKNNLVSVLINYENKPRLVKLNIINLKITNTVKAYLTTAAPKDNMRPIIIHNIKDGFILPARSITTIVFN